MRIRAISLHQPWATWIADDFKTIETRLWPTKVRGDVLICSSKLPKVLHGTWGPHPHLYGHALCLASIVDCRLFRREDEMAARCKFDPSETRYAWQLANVRRIETPFPVRGKQGFFFVDLPPEFEHLVASENR